MGKQNTSGETVGTPAWQKWESNAIQSTTQETWQNGLQRTSDPLAAGTYKYSWYFELRITPTGPINSRAQGRFRVDGTARGISHLGGDDADDWLACAGWDFAVHAAGDQPVLDIEFQRDPVVNGNDQVDIRRLKMAVELMPDG
jgi:hypothetical protein